MLLSNIYVLFFYFFVHNVLSLHMCPHVFFLYICSIPKCLCPHTLFTSLSHTPSRSLSTCSCSLCTFVHNVLIFFACVHMPSSYTIYLLCPLPPFLSKCLGALSLSTFHYLHIFLLHHCSPCPLAFCTFVRDVLFLHLCLHCIPNMHLCPHVLFRHIWLLCPPQTLRCTMSSSSVSVPTVLFLILHLHHCPSSLFLFICPSFWLPSHVLGVFFHCVRHVLFLHLCPMSSPYVSVHRVSTNTHCILSIPQSHPSSTSLSTMSLFNLCPPCHLPIYLSSVNSMKMYVYKFKWLGHPKRKLHHNLLTLKPSEVFMTFFFQTNTIIIKLPHFIMAVNWWCSIVQQKSNQSWFI